MRAAAARCVVAAAVLCGPLVLPPGAAACRCRPLTEAEARRAYAVVFEGEVVSVHAIEADEGVAGVVARVRVTRSIRGRARATVTVVSAIRRSVVNCPTVRLRRGQRATFYAREGAPASMRLPVGAHDLYLGACNPTGRALRPSGTSSDPVIQTW